MSDELKMLPTTMLTATDVHDYAVKGGATSAIVTAALKTGLPLKDLISLAMQFYTLGPKIWQVVVDVVTAIRSPTGFTLESLQELIAKDGPIVVEVVKAIFSLMGVALPAFI